VTTRDAYQAGDYRQAEKLIDEWEPSGSVEKHDGGSQPPMKVQPTPVIPKLAD
jgi:hypothetical protein